MAERFEQAARPVLVVENASFGNDFVGGRWYHIARTRHNTAGMFPVGGPERWDRLGVTLAPFREFGDDLILPQRGIGSPPVAMPRGFEKRTRDKFMCRVRRHPGRDKNPVPLETDLQGVRRVITWGSGAAIKALIMGCSVKSYMPQWIGQQDNTEDGRLAMFRRLIWAQWRLEEIAAGEPFRRLLA